MDKKEKKQIPLRISGELYSELERWAEDDFRSLNGEIEYLLTECVRYRRRGKNGLTPPLFSDLNADGTPKNTANDAKDGKKND
ncbi:MAG: PTS ascorbate transporter subunit IIC [Candidatus Coproplasma sp.]